MNTIELIKQRNAAKYSQYLGVNIDYRESLFKPEVHENASLLDVIYARDPETNLPKGDIALFMNENTSMEVRQFISQQLHSDISADTPEIPADFNGEFSDLLRAKGETRDEYMNRVSDLMRDENFQEAQKRDLERKLKEFKDE